VAGYSSTPLAQKLGIREGSRVALVGAPARFDATLGALPPSVALQEGLAGKAPLDVVVLFVTRRAELERRLPSVRRRMDPAAGF
jgi:hypothetical protein